jgi:hypothetical protein
MWACAAMAAGDPPNPTLAFKGTELYSVNGQQFTRYRLEVANRSAFSADLFTPSPGLPPCGSNTRSARAWLDIFDDKGARLYGFCALTGPDDLGSIWFALPVGKPAPATVHIVITDRLTTRTFTSNAVAVPAAPSVAGRTTPAPAPASPPAAAWVVVEANPNGMMAISTAWLSPQGAAGAPDHRTQQFSLLITTAEPLGNPPADFAIAEIILDCVARTQRLVRFSTYARPFAVIEDFKEPNAATEPLRQDFGKVADMACGGQSRWIGDRDVEARNLVDRYRAGL